MRERDLIFKHPPPLPLLVGGGGVHGVQSVPTLCGTRAIAPFGMLNSFPELCCKQCDDMRLALEHEDKSFHAGTWGEWGYLVVCVTEHCQGVVS